MSADLFIFVHIWYRSSFTGAWTRNIWVYIGWGV